METSAIEVLLPYIIRKFPMMSDKSTRSSFSNSVAGIDLSAQMIRDNLSCLGKHPIAQSHTFLALSAVGEGIRDIGRIESYPNLMYINLSDNLIDSLKPLEFLPALVQIVARYSTHTALIPLERAHSKFFT